MIICTEIEKMTDKEFTEFIQAKNQQFSGMDTVSVQPKEKITLIKSADLQKLK